MAMPNGDEPWFRPTRLGPKPISWKGWALFLGLAAAVATLSSVLRNHVAVGALYFVLETLLGILAVGLFFGVTKSRGGGGD